MDLTTRTAGFPTRKCGVLGCTGSVGQRFSLLLAQHPHFELVAVGASERSKGKTYREAVNWKQTTSMPPKIGALLVTECRPEHFKECDIVFSGLDSSVAGDVGSCLISHAPFFFCWLAEPSSNARIPPRRVVVGPCESFV